MSREERGGERGAILFCDNFFRKIRKKNYQKQGMAGAPPLRSVNVTGDPLVAPGSATKYKLIAHVDSTL